MEKLTTAAAGLSQATFWGLTLADIEMTVRIGVGVLTAIATVIWIVQKLRGK